MKTILACVAVLAAFGCSNLRQIQQVDMVEARVIKVDTVFRHPDHVKQLTWQDGDDVQYISYVSLYNTRYSVGSRMFVMRKR